MTIPQNMKTFNLECEILRLAFYEENNYLHYIFEGLKCEMFNDPINSEIFKMCLKLYCEGNDIDQTTIETVARNQNILSRLADISSIDIYTYKTREKCKTLYYTYYDKLNTQAKTLDDSLKLAELRQSNLFDGNYLKHISETKESIEERLKNKQKNSIVTLYTKLDDVIGSFKGGDLITLGGATGMCKTSFALNLARNICMQDKKVLYFSLEMAQEQLQGRFIAMCGNMSASKIRNLDFNLTDIPKYKQEQENLKEWGLYVVDDFNLTPERMRNYIKSQKDKKAVDFVILDYLGLLNGYSNKPTYERVTLLSRKMKALAGELDIPILSLAQLNRNKEERQDKTPKLSDLRDSGAIEQDSDYVLFVHRESMFDERVPKTELKVVIAKNRHGVSDKKVTLYFDLETQLIKDP